MPSHMEPTPKSPAARFALTRTRTAVTTYVCILISKPTGGDASGVVGIAEDTATFVDTLRMTTKLVGTMSSTKMRANVTEDTAMLEDTA